MNQDISYWLAEVQALQTQLAKAKQERDNAYADATNWQTRYQIEAKQRETDARLTKSEIDRLKSEIANLKGISQDNRESSDAESSSVESPEYGAIEQIEDPVELRQHLQRAFREYHRLEQAFQAERHAHAQTRQNLTLALGDAVDRLTQLQTDPSPSQYSSSQSEPEQ